MAKGIKAVKRFTKKELKEDKFVTSYFQVRKYLEEHQKNALRIGGGVLLLIILVAFWVISKKGAETQAANELGLAVIAAQSSDPTVVTEQFTQIAKRYKGTQAGEDALYYIAQLRGLQHQPEEALKAFEDYLRRSSKNNYLYPAALAGKAVALEDLKRYAEAASCYLQATEVKNHPFSSPSFLLEAGRCFRLAGDQNKAREQYQRVIQKHPKTSFAQQAEKELAALPS